MSTLSIARGNNRTFNLAFVQAAAPVNLSGAAIAVVVVFPSTPGGVASTRKVYGIGTGVTIVNEAGGLATWAVAPADTSGLPNIEQTATYEITLTDGLGRVTTTEDGTLEIIPTL